MTSYLTTLNNSRGVHLTTSSLGPRKKSTMNRKLNFVRLIALIIAQIKPKSAVSNTASLTSNKPRHPMVQTFNINNWGFEDADRKLLSEIKYKVDSLYEKSATTGK